MKKTMDKIHNMFTYWSTEEYAQRYARRVSKELGIYISYELRDDGLYHLHSRYSQ
jgi:hypothetical protein